MINFNNQELQSCRVEVQQHKMLNEEIKNSEAYQTFLALSTCLIPPKKGRGKGSKGKRATTATPRNKRPVTVENNIIIDPEEALKLGESISKTEAEE
ncbi:hypothetical protein Tco_1386339 [Tanacetum coccineum]